MATGGLLEQQEFFPMSKTSEKVGVELGIVVGVFPKPRGETHWNASDSFPAESHLRTNLQKAQKNLLNGVKGEKEGSEFTRKSVGSPGTAFPKENNSLSGLQRNAPFPIDSEFSGCLTVIHCEV
ncbi:hypothetical protein RUM44_007980 [Polyplax serrata]|uniref:Uncharacterized protein n=1 Tax=Polyplax serrata TaxID=468196 RepID=A0ABR1BBW0_POLSC